MGGDAGWWAGRKFEGLLARLNQAQEVLQDNPLDGENMCNGTLEAGDNSKEAKKQKRQISNMIWKWKWPASQEDEVYARETFKQNTSIRRRKRRKRKQRRQPGNKRIRVILL